MRTWALPTASYRIRVTLGTHDSPSTSGRLRAFDITVCIVDNRSERLEMFVDAVAEALLKGCPFFTDI
ncbi:hypothetical protein C6T71_05965 [Burkholderia multivorans]|nr:hypothetical protein C6T71_05965 [Burkholderia multivorans]